MAERGTDGSITLSTTVDQSGLKKGLAAMGKTVSKSFLAIGAAAATATLAITKMSVSAYADYEQLIGGVETLFKESAQKVKDYAEDAFYTAGVSANVYMQQVTSFSASLIKSTAGDTDKAADIANMALIDMSDNASKMGSSLESISTAYQGFAKQQYMLLDNLKLGYGGTKTEMERLLKDAQALTGVKYDINNLADVYSAIHAIQEELGIAGTTAKEAEKTISGSANMMKAAWQNVLTAISGGGDLDKAINNLVYAVEKYFDNIVPVVQRSLVGIGQLIEKVAPMLVQNVATALIKSIPSLVNSVYLMVIGLSKGIYEGIKALFTGEGGNITAEIKTTVGGIATEAGNASSEMEALGNATEEAGKKAQKSLAGFDQLNILSSGQSKTPKLDASGLKGATEVLSEMNVVAEKSETSTGWFNGKLEELKNAFKGLEEIDLDNLGESFKNLKEPLTGLANIAWNAILWGIENIIVPLAKFSTEEVLPSFIGKLCDRLSFLQIILQKLQPIWQTFYDNILKPVTDFATQKLLEFWEELNSKIKDIEEEIKSSEAWEDFQKIIEALSPAVVILVNALSWLLDQVISIVTSVMLTDLKIMLRDIADVIGLIAAVLTGDFSDAWGHFKNLIIDNRLQELKERFESVKETLLDFTEPLRNWVRSFSLAIVDMTQEWKTQISEWWENDVLPWFTVEKWKELGNNIKEGLLSGFKNAVKEIREGLGNIFGDFSSTPTTGSSKGKTASIKLPFLASGAVLPPNRPFMAVVGDQKHGTNVEAPLETIEQALSNVLSRGGFSNGNGTVILQVDGRTLGQVTMNQQQREERRIGMRMVTT